MADTQQALAAETMHKFLRINRYLRRYARQVNDYGIAPKKLSVLRFLLEQESATVGQVQEYLYNSASAASTLVSHLEEAGYVTRTRSPEDNRVVIVELTEAGRRLAESAPIGGLILLRRRLRDLPPDELSQIDQALDHIAELMEVTDEE